eukprot:TRINITY_DN33336_c0_g1_i1.p1 TRINITY_DN33336_c0_g1~~TRINITY_DN33336_c0_g1_i1.p1  ORF type:complete len:265 (-),score=83.29 TRINITY_DN33336_c0_g1_i1:277-1071(-)
MAAVPSAAAVRQACVTLRHGAGKPTFGPAAALRLGPWLRRQPQAAHRLFCSAEASPASSSSSSKASSSVEAQREKLRKLKEQEADIVSGKSSTANADGYLGGVVAVLFVGLAASSLGYVAWLVWSNSQRAEAVQKLLDEKELEDGMIKRPSGLLYKVIKKGSGTAHPAKTAKCTCRYTGTLVDGSVFEKAGAGDGVAAQMTPNQEVRGLAEALQLMVVGDVWELVLPPYLAYGDTARDKVPVGSALIYELELVSIQGNTVVVAE